MAAYWHIGIPTYFFIRIHDENQDKTQFLNLYKEKKCFDKGVLLSFDDTIFMPNGEKMVFKKTFERYGLYTNLFHDFVNLYENFISEFNNFFDSSGKNDCAFVDYNTNSFLELKEKISNIDLSISIYDFSEKVEKICYDLYQNYFMRFHRLDSIVIYEGCFLDRDWRSNVGFLSLLSSHDKYQEDYAFGTFFNEFLDLYRQRYPDNVISKTAFVCAF